METLNCEKTEYNTEICCIYFQGKYLTYTEVVIRLLKLQEIEDIINKKR